MYSKTQSKQKLTEGLHCTSERVGLMTVSSLVLTMTLFSHPRGLFCICMQQLFPPVSHGGLCTCWCISSRCFQPVACDFNASLSSFYHFITARLRIKKQFLLYIKDKSVHLILPIRYIHLEAGLITTCFCEWTLVSKLVKVFPRTEILQLVKMLKNTHTLHFNVTYRKRWCAGELFHLERSHAAFCSAQKHRRWQRLQSFFHEALTLTLISVIVKNISIFSLYNVNHLFERNALTFWISKLRVFSPVTLISL